MENLIVALIVGLALYFTFKRIMKMITAKGNCGSGCSCHACDDSDSCGPIDKYFHSAEDNDCCKPASR